MNRIRRASAVALLVLLGAGAADARQISNADGTVTNSVVLEAGGQPSGTDANPLVTRSPSNASGTTSTPTAAAAPAGPTPATSTSASLVAKASAANLYGFSFTQGATAGFMALLNATAAPAASAAITPIECVPVPINGYVARRQDIPDRYTAGLVVVSTSSCATYTAVTPVLISVVVQ